MDKNKKQMLLDMHNDTAFAVSVLKNHLDNPQTQFLTTRLSLEGFLEKATQEEKDYWESVKEKVLIL